MLGVVPVPAPLKEEEDRLVLMPREEAPIPLGSEELRSGLGGGREEWAPPFTLTPARENRIRKLNSNSKIENDKIKTRL